MNLYACDTPRASVQSKLLGKSRHKSTAVVPVPDFPNGIYYLGDGFFRASDISACSRLLKPSRGREVPIGAPNACKLESNSRRDGEIPQVKRVNWGIGLEQDRTDNNDDRVCCWWGDPVLNCKGSCRIRI